ncbi:indole-3-acetate beta-glucosyltransferase-like [Lolium perenne]|uniref:indole-3-acetate beta-glucosyltransferase-like n=1 Tax=Lolium perenne TaxID=4522 RepID=UPI0021E9FE49|nr:indole-3-acetate beta-glucosyltransferase-like [Lolium perenne]
MAHVLVVPMPGQGHINPMVQFAKKLVLKGVAATLVTTRFIARTTRIDAGQVQVEAISDGHDDGGFSSAASPEEYLQKLEVAGSASLAELIKARAVSGRPFTCVVYDSFLRWAARTARVLDLPAVPFSTQSCAVSAVYHYVNEGKLPVPAAGGEKSVALAGLPEMERWEFPTFLFGDGPYASLTMPALTQFAGRDEDDWVLFNSFEELEAEVLAGLSSHFKARAIGPCVPLPTAESGHADRFTYGANLLDPAEEDTCIKWLDNKPPGSVAYVSFGSLASLGAAQTEELARGLLAAGMPFLWVVRATEEVQLPRHLLDPATASGTALIVRWCPQLDVLAHRAVGCFVTHCGWNSTLEALGFGVPMVALPIWTDQPINARLIEGACGAGVRARRDAVSGIFLRDEIESCVHAVMDDDGIAASAREAARRWSDAARAAVVPGGSSDRNLDEFVEFVRANADKNKKPLGLENSETRASRAQDVICM